MGNGTHTQIKPAPSAFAGLQDLIHTGGRKGLVRRELTALGYSSWQVDRALSRARQLGLITRVGHGVYAVGDARIAEIMPEVLPKLGYQILPTPKLDNYSIRRSGVTYRLDRPCRRLVMRDGVVATFETPDGKLTRLNTGKGIDPKKLPTTREIEEHFRTFQYCHSPARAEKDMIVNRVLDVYDNHTDPEVAFAIEGGTSLAQYQGVISRFSEDLDIRVLFDDHELDSRHDLMRDVGARLKERIADELPFLEPTNKGRLRRDGVIHTIIFDYEGNAEHQDVVHRVKVKLLATPLVQPVLHVIRNHQSCPVVTPLEILAGKFAALSERLPGRGDSNPDLVRHVHDIAASVSHITPHSDEMLSLIGDVSSNLPDVVKELSRPVWKNHYTTYMRRMGSLPTFDADRESIPRTHLAWTNVLTQFAAICRTLDVIGDEVRDMVGTAVNAILAKSGSKGLEL